MPGLQYQPAYCPAHDKAEVHSSLHSFRTRLSSWCTKQLVNINPSRLHRTGGQDGSLDAAIRSLADHNTTLTFGCVFLSVCSTPGSRVSRHRRVNLGCEHLMGRLISPITSHPLSLDLPLEAWPAMILLLPRYCNAVHSRRILDENTPHRHHRSYLPRRVKHSLRWCNFDGFDTTNF